MIFVLFQHFYSLGHYLLCNDFLHTVHFRVRKRVATGQVRPLINVKVMMVIDNVVKYIKHVS